MILDNVSHLLPGLLPGVYRGVPFFAPDVRTTAGRRVAEHLFPGVDRAAYDDQGISPAQITVSGILMGDDYIAQARAMQAVLERSGAGTLIHPWLGPMTVILVEPAEVSFQANELRVARFDATFTRVGGGGLSALAGGLISTAGQLTDAAAAMASAAFALAKAVR